MLEPWLLIVNTSKEKKFYRGETPWKTLWKHQMIVIYMSHLISSKKSDSHGLHNNKRLPYYL